MNVSMGFLTPQVSGFMIQGGGKGLASEAEIRDEEPVEILSAYGFKHTENPC
jgi:hypothetical protein